MEIDSVILLKEINQENSNTYSELIVNEIIEKIISLTISESYNNEIYKFIPNHCFNDIKTMMNSMIHTSYVMCDRDDHNENLYSNDPSVENSVLSSINPGVEVFFDNKYQGLNHWVHISEPRKSKVDRAACSQIKVVKDKDKASPVNIIHSSDRELVSKNSEIDLTSNTSHVSMSIMSVNKQTSRAQPATKKVAEMEQWLIPDIKNNTEENIIMNLREDKIREWKKKEEDVKNKQLLVEKEKENVRLEYNKKLRKEVDGRKITSDVNGNPVVIKNVICEKLANDFYLPKYIMKYLFRYEIKELIQKTEREFNKKVNKALPAKASDIKASAFNNNNSYKQNYLTLNDRTPAIIIPAGSNYDLIVPETGVTIIEGSKKKIGDNDYFKRFQKYSKYDYNSMLKDASVITKKSLQVFDKDDSLNQMRLSLPTISLSRRDPIDGMNTQEKDNFSGLGLNVNKLGHSSENMKISNRLTMSLKSTLDALDLIPEFEEKLQSNDDDVEESFGYNNFNNLFNRKLKNKNEELTTTVPIQDLETINKFNYSIINNSKWGSTALLKTSNNKPRKHYKPSQKELEKEVGVQIVKTKLPRSRTFSMRYKN